MTLVVKKTFPESDPALLAAVAGGSRQALEKLYLRYHRRITRFLSRITQRYDQVEEIVNDTFLSVWQGAGQFRHASAVSTWIFGIAYRTALKSLRQQRTGAVGHPGNYEAEDSFDLIPQLEAENWLAHGLNQLPVEQRLTLELAYFMGYSIEEIALITSSPAGTVKARMFYAREKLRQCLPALGGTLPQPPRR